MGLFLLSVLIMDPQIIGSRFGALIVRQGDKEVEYTYDILIRPDTMVSRRAKELSKEVYGTSHRISLAEAEHIYCPGTRELVIGAGLFKRVRLSPEAAAYLDERDVRVHLAATPKAIKRWNGLSGDVIGLFHVTC